jgi:hypothetical protein
LVPLTHGKLLYTAWALSLVTTLAQEDLLLRGLARFVQRCWWPEKVQEKKEEDNGAMEDA